RRAFLADERPHHTCGPAFVSATPQTPQTFPHPHIRSYSGRRGHFTSGQRLAYETLRERWCVAYDPTRTLDAQRAAEPVGRTPPLGVEIVYALGDAPAC